MLLKCCLFYIFCRFNSFKPKQTHLRLLNSTDKSRFMNFTHHDISKKSVFTSTCFMFSSIRSNYYHSLVPVISFLRWSVHIFFCNQFRKAKLPRQHYRRFSFSSTFIKATSLKYLELAYLKIRKFNKPGINDDKQF